MKNCLPLILISILSTSACTSLTQNDFISTEYIGQIGEEKMIYSAYQTGIDNYRIEFKSVVGSDTSDVFDYDINDALFTVENTFDFKVATDTLFILSPFDRCKTYHSTKRGVVIVVTRSFDMEACKQ